MGGQDDNKLGSVEDVLEADGPETDRSEQTELVTGNGLRVTVQHIARVADKVLVSISTYISLTLL